MEAQIRQPTVEGVFGPLRENEKPTLKGSVAPRAPALPAHRKNIKVRRERREKRNGRGEFGIRQCVGNPAGFNPGGTGGRGWEATNGHPNKDNQWFGEGKGKRRSETVKGEGKCGLPPGI